MNIQGQFILLMRPGKPKDCTLTHSGHFLLQDGNDFLEVRSVQTLLRVVRSITALNQLARTNQGDSFQQQCQACLNIATPMLSAQDLENLFSLHLSLRIPWYQQHPAPAGGFCHASASASASGTGVLIRIGTRTRGRWTKTVAIFCSCGC